MLSQCKTSGEGVEQGEGQAPNQPFLFEPVIQLTNFLRRVATRRPQESPRGLRPRARQHHAVAMLRERFPDLKIRFIDV
jgi:hypothetical protein